MTETIEDLRKRMEAAAQAEDFEEARRLRDRISLLRGSASDEDAAVDTSDLECQAPGQMVLALVNNV